MRPSDTYRAARRNLAHQLGLFWPVLRRASVAITRKWRVVMVVLPPDAKPSATP